MSGKLIEKLIDLKLPISHAAQAVLMALARHANDDGTSCFPSMDTIQEFARASRGTVVRCIEQLCSLGVVVPERGVGRRSNHYTINATGQPVGVPPQHYNGSGSGLTIEPQAAAQPVDKSPPRPRRSLMVDRRSPTTGLDSIKTQRKKDSEANASDAEAASPPPSSRDLVWSQGVPLVRHLTGKTDAQCRSMLGRMLRDVRDDCPRLLMVLQQARDFQPIDPVAWLTAATKPRSVKAGRDERILRAAGLWDDGTDFDFDHEPRGMLQ